MKELLMGVVIVFVIFISISIMASKPKPIPFKEQIVYDVAKEFVNRRLKTTTNFPDYDPSFVKLCPNGRYRVVSYVNNKKFMCLIENHGIEYGCLELNIMGE